MGATPGMILLRPRDAGGPTVNLTHDPLDHIPDPEAVQRLLAAAVRRSALLRGLLRLARRKAAYPPPPSVPVATYDRPPSVVKGVARG